MDVLRGWMPASRENWVVLTKVFTYFPLITGVQWLITWYPTGKTSIQSRLNIPGRIGWMTMEAPGMLNMLYIMYTLPKQLGIESLPLQNKILAALYVTHYIYRAIIGPLIAPVMSPMHIIIWAFAFCFQYTNSTSIGGWLAGYGPTTESYWAARPGWQMSLGLALWAGGLAGNIYHDEVLRQIRRDALKKQQERAKIGEKNNDRVYEVPQAGLFRWILYPHYLCEWIEWTGFWIFAGLSCNPARIFVFNEITTMLPRAVQGRQWYLQKFGKEKIGDKTAVIPKLL